MHIIDTQARQTTHRRASRAFKPALVLSSLLAMLVGCGADTNKGPGAGFKRPPTPVVTEAVAVRDLSDVINAIGNTQANESVTITAKVTDTVSKVHFDDGQLVEAGDVLIELTNAEETALLNEALANRTDAETQLERLSNLYEQRTIPLSQVDEAKARANAARARYNSVVARLDDRLIRAPFSGSLGFRQVSAGTLITPGTAIATLDDISVIKLDFAIPEVYLAQLKLGLNLRAYSSAYTEETFIATIAGIDTRVDPVTRTARARALIDNADHRLKPGMLLTVALSTRPRTALAVSETAIIQRSGRAFVYVVSADDSNQQVAVMRPIVIGTRSDGYAEILSGLSLGERVIIEGTIKVRDGAPVTELAAGDSNAAVSMVEQGQTVKTSEAS
ncbi:MAG: efflux RND transporter periplasmic adaptor subunit [Pseudomonadaceae bacterium]|nr:efflux RND transporter periplasmic adaptor subunit [Pseudomonadaceae bacterium]